MSKSGVLESERMGAAFALLRSRDLMWTPAVEQYVQGERPKLNDLMAWNADGTRMPWRMHSEYLERLYLKNELARGTFTVKGERLDLARVRLPMFVVGTETDHVAPWRSVYKVRALTRSRRLHLPAHQRRSQCRHRERPGEPEAPPSPAHLERRQHAPRRGRVAEGGTALRRLLVAGLAAVAGAALRGAAGPGAHGARPGIARRRARRFRRHGSAHGCSGQLRARLKRSRGGVDALRKLAY